MTDNESSLNKQQNIKQTDLKLDPWLQKRLEERAHPLDFRRSSTGKINLLSSGSQQLLRLGQAGTWLARSTMKHTGLSSLLSRAGSLTFLSRASRNIVKRSVIAESPYTHPILDLPWFSPEQNITQNDIDQIGLDNQRETTSNTIVRSTHPLSNTLSESGKYKTTIRHEKKPETYINRLISPPITRRTTVDIGNRTISKASEKEPSVKTRQMAAPTYPVVPNKPSEIRNMGSSDRRPEIVISKPIISTKSESDTGKFNIRSKDISSSEKLPTERAKGITNEIDRKTKDTNSELPAKWSEAPSGIIRNQHDKPVKTEESSPKDVTTTLNRNSSPGNSDTGEKKAIDSYDTQSSIEMEHTAAITEKQQISKSSDTGKNIPEKEVNQVYPAQELVHRKPFSIGKRIVQSLPIIRNISRKDARMTKMPTSDAEKLLNHGDTQLSLKQTEMVHSVEEIPNALPESDRFTNLSSTDKIKAESHLPIPESQEVGYEILVTKTPHLTVSHDSEGQVIRERTYQSYPVEESVQRKPLPIGQRSMRILPLAGSVSSEISEPSEDIFSLGAKLFESEVIPAQKTYDNPYIPVSSLPITSPVNIDVNTTGRGETTVGRQIAVSDSFAKPSNSRLDLTIAPITHTNISGQQGNHRHTDDDTQYLQRLETSSSSQTATQTQTQQSRPQDITQESQTRTTESSVNTNPYKPDIKALAREIYPLIRRMIIIERERRPSR